MDCLVVCLHIFSGIEDPHWEVQSSSPHFTIISDLLQHHINTDHPSVLGYRGYTVQWKRNGQLLHEYRIAKKTSVELERELLVTAPQEIKERVGEYVIQELA